MVRQPRIIYVLCKNCNRKIHAYRKTKEFCDRVCSREYKERILLEAEAEADFQKFLEKNKDHGLRTVLVK